MATQVPADTELTSLHRGVTRPIEEWVTTFQLALVVIDPYTHESSWILPTATRILRTFSEADCRTGFLVTAPPEDARQFLGPLVDELMVLVDPQRKVVRAMEVTSLPAFVHIDQSHTVVGRAEGWDPAEWRSVAKELARVMSWQRPAIPLPQDPVPFEGTPAMTEGPTTA